MHDYKLQPLLMSLCMHVQDSKTLLPGMDPVQMLRTNPDMVLSLVKGKHMVPYDQVCACVTATSVTDANTRQMHAAT
jgi:hypothetical protein